MFSNCGSCLILTCETNLVGHKYHERKTNRIVRYVYGRVLYKKYIFYCRLQSKKFESHKFVNVDKLQHTFLPLDRQRYFFTQLPFNHLFFLPILHFPTLTDSFPHSPFLYLNAKEKGYALGLMSIFHRSLCSSDESSECHDALQMGSWSTCLSTQG